MSCSNPLLAVDFGVRDDGKRSIKILPRRVDFDFNYYKSKFGDSLLMLPCGQCDACILARRKQWSLRCYAESLYHDENCFITLTYDDDHCPSKLSKSDFQKFIKDLRNEGFNIRYFGCGEYGGVTQRPHYHLVIFGFFPSDAKYFSKSKSGFPQYTSSLISNIWHKGFVTVSEFSPEVAGYTAGYVDKKYKDKDSFILMSKKPGLGEQFFKDHYNDFYETDSLVVNFGSHVSRIPRYFDKLAEKIGFDLTKLKDNRLIAMSLATAKEMRELDVAYVEEYLKKRGSMFKDKLDKKKRGL